MEREWRRRTSWSSFFPFDKFAYWPPSIFFLFSRPSPLLSLFGPLKLLSKKTGNDRPQHLPPPVASRLRRVQDHGRGKGGKIGFNLVSLFFHMFFPFFSTSASLSFSTSTLTSSKSTSSNSKTFRRPSASSPPSSPWRSSTTRRRSRCTSTPREGAPTPP